MLSLLRAVGAPAATSVASRSGADNRAVRITGLHKHFGSLQALRDVVLQIDEGEMVAITGPSGAGKSTLGRLISGLETADAGEISIGGRAIGHLPPHARRVAHMFESFALYPTRTVRENITSPLVAPGHRGRFDAASVRRRVDEVLALTEMTALSQRLPSQLSGGQKQRVALCRALVQDPSVYVLDEPIGHLDVKLRHRLRGDIRRRQRQSRSGTLWLTPDGLEAMAVADRMLVLIGGEVQQFDRPDTVHAQPANVRVARLIGDPAMNVVPLTLREGFVPQQIVGDATEAVPASSTLIRLFGPRSRAGRLQIGLRPSALMVIDADSSPRPAGMTDMWPARVYAVEPLGQQSIVTVEAGGHRLRSRRPGVASWRVGQPVRLAFDAERALAFDAETGARID